MAVAATLPINYARLERAEKLALFAFFLPSALFLVVFFFYPISSFLLQSLFDPGFTLEHYTKALTKTIYLKILWKTLMISLITTLFCVLLGYPVAFVMAHASGKVKAIVLALVLIPFWTNILVRMFAWLALLGRYGVFNTALMETGITESPTPMLYNMTAVVIGMTHIMLPYMILPCYAVMTGIPQNLLDAASNLGAPPRKVFWRVYFPLSLPGLGAGCLLVFIISLGFFITPALMGGPKDVMLAQIIELQINETLNWGFGAALSGMLLVVTITLYFLYERLISVEKIYEGR